MTTLGSSVLKLKSSSPRLQTWLSHQWVVSAGALSLQTPISSSTRPLLIDFSNNNCQNQQRLRSFSSTTRCFEYRPQYQRYPSNGNGHGNGSEGPAMLHLSNQPPPFRRIKRASKSLRVSILVLLGTSVLLVSFIGYETMVNGVPVYLPVYILPWSRKALPGELAPDTRQVCSSDNNSKDGNNKETAEEILKAAVLKQLSARVAVDETIGSVLGVPCKLERTCDLDPTSNTSNYKIDSIDVTINAPGPALVCLKIYPLSSPTSTPTNLDPEQSYLEKLGLGFTNVPKLGYKQVARSLLWWLAGPSPRNSATSSSETKLHIGSDASNSKDVATGTIRPRKKGESWWWWDIDEQEIVITGSVIIHGPGPNCHSHPNRHTHQNDHEHDKIETGSIQLTSNLFNQDNLESSLSSLQRQGKSGKLTFVAVKSFGCNEFGLRFRKTVLTYTDDFGRVIEQRLW